MITADAADKQADVVYTFDGKKDDVVAVELTTIAAKDKSLFINLRVTDKGGSDVGYGNSALFGAMADGSYTITLSNFTGEGKFTLKLIKAQPLTLGTPVKVTISLDKDMVPTSMYYYFNSTAAFTVKLDTEPQSAKSNNTLQWGLVIREHFAGFNDYSDVFNYVDSRNVILSTSVTIQGSDAVIALGVHPSGYSFGDMTQGATQPFTLTVSAAK